MTSEVLVIDVHAHIYAEQLRQHFPDLKIHAAHDHSEIPDDISKVDVLFAFGISINDPLMQRLSDLKWIQSLATGIDHFLRCPSLKPEVLITSGRGIHGAPMRETTVLLMLSLSQNTQQRSADRRDHFWQRRLWSLLCDKTAVLVGIGVAGTAIGQLLKAFGMKVVGVSREPRQIEGFDKITPRERLLEAAAEADYLINILPGSPENHGIFGRAVFEAMKPSAFFINVGRGETVDEQALLSALQSGRIAGAGLDVFATEPLPKESPFWDMPNVAMNPHIGGFFIEYEDFIMPLVIENMGHFLAGRRSEMRNIVAR
jgi:phosphoglycerate dehydrogenase-like enzyme